MFTALQTIKCMLQLKVNIIVNEVSNVLIFLATLGILAGNSDRK